MLGYVRRHLIGFRRGGRELTGCTELREVISVQMDGLLGRHPGLQLSELHDAEQSTPA